MRKTGLLATLLTLLALSSQFVSPAFAEPGRPSALADHVAGEVLVGFLPGASATARESALRSVGAIASEQLSPLAPDARVVRLGGFSVEAAISALSRNPSVRYVEPNYIVTAAVDDANDPGYTTGIGGATTWGLFGPSTIPNTNSFGSGAGQVWRAGWRGSASVYVGDIDTGVQISHPDLDDNIWRNPGEVAGNGIDDDMNDYVDDLNGWDFFHGDASVYDPADGDDHGTHTAGTIGAEGNNGEGVAGVNWDVTIIPAKFLGPNGGAISDAVKAVDYLTDLKTRYGLNLVATNNSWGGGGSTQSLLDAINRAADQNILFVAAAGNGGSDGIGDNNDLYPSYPSGYTCTRKADGTSRGWDCVIAVAAMRSSGDRSGYSNFGATTVDLAAPGSGVLSTVPTSGYASFSGTSMATPHVTGALALCASMGGLVGSGLRTALMNAAAATPTSAFASITATGGRLYIPAMQSACTSVAPLSASSYALGITVVRNSLDGVTGAGSVTTWPDASACSSGTCTTSAKGTVTLVATPAAGSRFVGWSGGTGNCTGAYQTCIVQMSAARSTTATFAPSTYTFSVSVSKSSRTSPSVSISTTSGTAWSVPACTSTCPASLVYSTTVRLVANAAGTRFIGWSGACSGVTSTTCTVTINAAKSVTATFRK